MTTKEEKVCYLYHIRRKCMADDLTQGYVGISINIDKRWSEHKRKVNSSPLVSEALDKYDDVGFVIISEGSISEIRRMERWLRPERFIGWNNAKGGGGVGTHTNTARSNMKGLRFSGKLSKESVIEIYKAVGSNQSIANNYGVSRSMIGFIKRKERFTEILEELDYDHSCK